jgi:hypothetical protein
MVRDRALFAFAARTTVLQAAQPGSVDRFGLLSIEERG